MGRAYRRERAHTPLLISESMKIVDIDIVRAHCNSLPEDDTLIEYYTGVAEEMVISETRRTDDELKKMGGGDYPNRIKQAVILIVAHFYRVREAVSSINEILTPYAYNACIKPFRKFATEWGHEESTTTYKGLIKGETGDFINLGISDIDSNAQQSISLSVDTALLQDVTSSKNGLAIASDVATRIDSITETLNKDLAGKASVAELETAKQELSGRVDEVAKVANEAKETASGTAEALTGKADKSDLVFVKGKGDYSQASYYYDYDSKKAELNNALTESSHAEGRGTTASEDSAHAEGNSTIAKGTASHAEGSYTEASARYSHAEGCSTIASGYSSHVEGEYTTASSYCSHAEGSYTEASARYSHAEGYNTIAKGEYSHTEGFGIQTTNYYEHAQGYYNLSTTSDDEKQSTLHSIGNGYSGSTYIRHNAVEVKFNGDYYIQEKTTTDDDSLNTYEAPMKRLQTWLNEKADKTAIPDIQINSTSIVKDGVANIPVASSTQYGVTKEWLGTQSEFDALTTLDENTNYYVV